MTGLAYMTGPPGHRCAPVHQSSTSWAVSWAPSPSSRPCASASRTGKAARSSAACSSCPPSSSPSTWPVRPRAATPSPPMPARSSAWGIYETFETARRKSPVHRHYIRSALASILRRVQQADWFADPRFRTNADRVNNRDALRALVAGVARAHSRDELAGILEKASIPFASVNTPSDLFNDPQMLAHALPTRMPSRQHRQAAAIAYRHQRRNARLAPSAARRRRTYGRNSRCPWLSTGSHCGPPHGRSHRLISQTSPARGERSVYTSGFYSGNTTELITCTIPFDCATLGVTIWATPLLLPST